MAAAAPRREELAAFLRSRRRRVHPAQVGLPSGGRRLNPGLRREEVAILAGISPTWYTYLEQGRDIHPSVEVLDRLAQVLQLSQDERLYLRRLASDQGDAPIHHPREADTDEVLGAIALSTGQYPVYVSNYVGDIVHWNAATTEWYGDFELLPPDRRNMLWWMFTVPDARDRLVDWEEEARDLLARLRVVSAGRPVNARLTELITKLGKVSPDFDRLWSDHEVRVQRDRVRRMRHPTYGTKDLRLVVLSRVGGDTQAIVFHVPVERPA